LSSTQLKLFFDKIGGPKAISFVAWVVLSPVAIIGPVYSFDEALIGQNLEVISLATILSYIVSGIVLLFAYKTYLKPDRTKSRPVAALATFFLAGAMSGLSLSILSGVFGLEPEPDYLGRAVTRGWFGLFWSCVVVLFVDSRFRYKEAAARLNVQITDNQKLISERAEIVESVRAELVESVRQTLGKILEHPSQKLLSRLADEVIRPLSRAIEDKGVSFTLSSSLSEERIKIAPVLLNSLKRPATSLVIPIAAGLSAILATLASIGPGAIANLALFVAVYAATTAIVKRANFRSASVAFMGWMVGLTSLSFLTFPMQGADSPILLRTILVNAGVWLLSMILNLQAALESSRSESLVRLSNEVELTSWHRKKLQQEVWVESRRLAKYVHGDIQGRIRAAALTTSDLTPEALERLKNACLEALESRPGGLNLEDFLEQSIQIWAEAMKIEFKVTAAATGILEHDSFALESVIETVREALVNAVRHGQARRARIEIFVGNPPKQNSVVVKVTNDGRPVPKQPERGIGGELLSEVTSFWELVNSSEGVVLMAQIPAASGLQSIE
jgi:hypothetical protein